MYFVQFNAPRVVEFNDPQAFEKRVRRFLSLREAENSYLLIYLPGILQKTIAARLFVIEEEESIVAAGFYLNSGGVVMTWASPDAIDALAEYAVKNNWNIVEVFAPGHCSQFLGNAFAQRTGRRIQMGRAERVYHLTRSIYQLPEEGHLEVATEADEPLAKRWLRGFIEEADYENDGRTLDQKVRDLVGTRSLYFWKTPRAVSMAGWVCPTPNGAAINFVYTPPELRGRGYGKAVTAALASQMLASGLKYCFIRVDSDDPQANAMYQSVGAQTLCEFVRCTIHAADTMPSRSHFAATRSHAMS